MGSPAEIVARFCSGESAGLAVATHKSIFKLYLV
jgi:hypothetical protein